MFAQIEGHLSGRRGNAVIVKTNGVGYLIEVSSLTLGNIGNIGDYVSLEIETVVREDAFNLFGFKNNDEREIFSLITKIQGVGAKVAMSILSLGTPDEIMDALYHEDKSFISKANGVGPKLVLRIMTELKGKIPEREIKKEVKNTFEDKVVAVLISLGYGKIESKEMMKKVDIKSVNDISQAVKICLQKGV